MPDVRHLRDQKFCSKPECRKAGKHDSQRRWYYSPKGAEYRDPEYNKQRVREWRAAHPDYARLAGGRPRRTPPSAGTSKHFDGKTFATGLPGDALQDSIFSQPFVAEVFIARLTGNALQEMIVIAAWSLVDSKAAHPGDRSKARRKVDTVFAKTRNDHKTEEICNHVWHI